MCEARIRRRGGAGVAGVKLQAAFGRGRTGHPSQELPMRFFRLLILGVVISTSAACSDSITAPDLPNTTTCPGNTVGSGC